MIGGDQGIPQSHVDPLPPVGRHRVRRVPQEQQTGGRPGLQAADDDIQQHRVLERFGVRPQVRGQVGRGAVQQLLGEPVRPGGAAGALYCPFWMVIPTHSRPSAVGIPPVRQPGPSSSRTVVRSGQKSGKGTRKFRTSKCCGDGSSVKAPRLRTVE